MARERREVHGKIDKTLSLFLKYTEERDRDREREREMGDSSGSVSIDMEAMSLGGQVNDLTSLCVLLRAFRILFGLCYGKNKIGEMVLYWFFFLLSAFFELLYLSYYLSLFIWILFIIIIPCFGFDYDKRF